jgi:hypothetical protein
LIQEAQVILEKHADVRNAVFSHSEPFDSEAERPAGDVFLP